MAARESFEQSQLASQIGIGYGEAQVLPDRAALIEQTRANKAREEIARGKLKAKQDKVDKDKRKELTPKFPTGIATPLQYSVNKEIKDIYLGLAESYDSPDYEQKKIEAMYRIGVITEEAKNLTNDYNAAYEFHEENKGEQKFSDSYGESALYGTSIDENTDATYEEVAEKMRKNIGDMQQHYTPQGFTQIATTLKPQVSEMTEKGKTTWVGEGGAILSSETEEFPIEKANDLIFRNISQATNANDWLQSGLAAMSDDQKKAYGTDLNGVAQWWADENDEKFVIDVTKGTRTKPIPDKKPTGYDFTTDVVTETRPIAISTPYSEDGKGISKYSQGTSYVSWTPPRDISFILPTGVDIIPFDIKEDDNWDDTMKEVKESFKKPGSGSFKLAEVSTMNAYGPGTVGRKNSDIKLEGLLADEFFNMTEEEILAEYSSQRGYTDADRKRDIAWIRKTKEGMVKTPMAIIKRTSGTEEEKNTTYYVPYDKVRGKITNKFNKSQKPYVEQVENALYMRDEQPTSGGTTTGGGASKFNK